MKRILDKDLIEKYIKKEIDPNIRDVIVDVLYFLSQKGYNILGYIKQINETRFIVFDPEKCKDKKIKYTFEGKEKEVKTNWKSYEGFYLPIIDLDKDNNIVLVEKIYAINENGTIKNGEKSFKQKIIHELLHLISSRNKVTKEDGKNVIYIGVNKVELEVENDELHYRIETGNTEINEAMTELLANNIYKELYDDNFYMTTIEKEGAYYPCLNIYYINTNFLRILNIFAHGTDKTDKLLFAYLNNNLNYYIKGLEKTLGIDYNSLKFLMARFEENMNLYFQNRHEGEIYFEKNMPVIFEAISYNLYETLKNMDMKEELKKVYIEYLKIFINFVCCFPLFNLVVEDFKKSLSKLDLI